MTAFPTKPIQGWTLHNLHHSTHPQTRSRRLHSLTPTSPAWLHIYFQAHTPHDFEDAPTVAVQTLLSYPALSLDEDTLFHALLRYVARRNGLTNLPQNLTQQLIHLLKPLLAIFVPSLRLLSLSPRLVAHILEPTHLLDEHLLLEKYRFDALTRQLACGSTLTNAQLCSSFPEISHRNKLYNMFRGRAVIAESEHPYHQGEDEIIEEICVGEWASQMCIEFDRRSSILPGATLTFYRDRDATDVLAYWHLMWNQNSQSEDVKSMVVNDCRVFVGFKTNVDATPAWGWSLFAVPLLDNQNNQE